MNEFLNRNHLQGKDNSEIKLGLYFKEELVSVMTFGKPRFNKSYEYELIRYACNINTTIIGGASKLLKYFERHYNPKSIISYADRRYSNGGLYEKLGFSFLNISKSNYFYCKNGNRLSRYQCQKHKLYKKLKNFDEHKTEYENMKNNGYNRIYDCGNIVYIKKLL